MRKAFVLLVPFVFLVPLSFSAIPETPAVTLAQAGKPPLTMIIVGDTNRLAVAEPALADLKRILKVMTGADFESGYQEKPFPFSRSAIFIGTAADLNACGLDVPVDLKPQECVIRSRVGNRLILAGGNAWGVSHAIYGFLEKLGCRWYYPGAPWEVVPPANPDLRVSLDVRESPAFDIQRRIWIGHGMHSPTIQKDYADWMRRNRAGAPVGVACSHSWPVPQEAFTNHPDWFARVNGKRSNGKPCYSHPDVIQAGIRRALDYFKGNPGADMISVSAPDGIGFCSCELCLKTAGVASCVETNGTFFGTRPDGAEVCVVSETIFRYANAVSKAVADAYPGKMVGCLAYSAYAHPPSFGLASNLYVEVTRGYRRTPMSQADQLAAFAKIASMLGIYEYYDVEQWSWDQPGAARACDLTYIGETLRYYNRNKIRSLSGEMSNNFAPNGIGYYLILRLLWDPASDVRAVEGDFYQRAFGPAAEPVCRFYRRWESGQRLDERTLGLAFLDLKEAADQSAGQPGIRGRVDQLRMYAHFLKLYVQPKEGANEAEDVKRLKERFGEAGAKARVQALGDWASRLMDTHMVHGWAFNRYLIKRGDGLGCNTTNWMKPGAIPAGDEVERLFAADLAELKPDRSKEVAGTLWSRRLSSFGPAAQMSRSGLLQADRGLTWVAPAGTNQPLLLASTSSNMTVSGVFMSRAAFENEWLETAGQPVDVQWKTNRAAMVTAPEEGYFRIRTDGVPIFGQPAALLQGGPLKTATLFFWVPKETERFLLTVKGARGTLALTVRDGRGKTMLEAENDKVPGTHLIEVPAEAAGAAWSVEGPGEINGTAVFTLTGVPPWFSLRPESLLVPREAM